VRGDRPVSGRYDPGVTEPGLPVLALDGLEAVVFDTDGVLTNTASVHAAAWKRLFDEYLALRTSRGQEPFRPYEEADLPALHRWAVPLRRRGRLPGLPGHPAALG
jgi:hypothetical protein